MRGESPARCLCGVAAGRGRLAAHWNGLTDHGWPSGGGRFAPEAVTGRTLNFQTTKFGFSLERDTCECIQLRVAGACRLRTAPAFKIVGRRMLRHWQLQNFKSFRLLPPVTLSMVNVLAGPNSSGKSSLIQSILLLKQTLQYGAEERPITLNGPLLRIGSFSDIRNFDAGHDPIEIAFDFEVRVTETDESGTPHWARSPNYAYRRHGGALWDQISLSISYNNPIQLLPLDEPVQSANLNPALISTSLTVKGSTNDERTSQTCQFVLGNEFGWPYSVYLDSESELEMIGNKPDGEIVGGFISYFLPHLSLVRYDKTKVEVNALVGSIFRPDGTLLGLRPTPDAPLSQNAVAIINNWLVQHKVDPLPNQGEPVIASEARARLLSFQRQPNIGGLLSIIEPSESVIRELEELKEQVRGALLGEREAINGYTGARSDGADYALNFLSDFFKFGIRYLGPLRDSPRPVYQPEALEGNTDVGYRGEHTAAVFEMNKGRTVSFRAPPASDTESDYVGLAKDTKRSLEEATAEWLEYLGVASSVKTMDAGVFGNRMQVSIEQGAPLHDLTNVGVGVSQILPIVVMALLAPSGSFLIFEQPELHLHPKVQARLADFFLALAIDGKQTLLETHSEYLVDRLRLRIAMAQSDNVRPLVNILFSEKKNGCSSLTPIVLSEFGSIVNWPTDFFEQSQRDVGKIVQAASLKRKSRPRRD